jgi:hypothetical protein
VGNAETRKGEIGNFFRGEETGKREREIPLFAESIRERFANGLIERMKDEKISGRMNTAESCGCNYRAEHNMDLILCK